MIQKKPRVHHPGLSFLLLFYAAFTSVGVGVGDVVEGGRVASIGTTFPFPIRLAAFHSASAFGSAANTSFTWASSNLSTRCARAAVVLIPSRAPTLLRRLSTRESIDARTAPAAATNASAKFSGRPFSTNTC